MPPKVIAMKILLPVDGSTHSDRAVRQVISEAKAGADIQVDLINVQPPIAASEVFGHIPAYEIEAMQETRGGDALQSARALLDKADVPYTPVVRIGPVAETIARYAVENSCDSIVMGTRGLGAIRSVLMGSVATRLLSLTELPVTLVK
jgi:nucleotide-binding universal stress UspA family protein